MQLPKPTHTASSLNPLDRILNPADQGSTAQSWFQTHGLCLMFHAHHLTVSILCSPSSVVTGRIGRSHVSKPISAQSPKGKIWENHTSDSEWLRMTVASCDIPCLIKLDGHVHSIRPCQVLGLGTWQNRFQDAHDIVQCHPLSIHLRFTTIRSIDSIILWGTSFMCMHTSKT